ncbi:ceramidase [Aspergillus saccharolyticus JOP 1030-1]|uniref:Putative alkaline phytoceramidase n=1 Tax=Aspergillus saccharolyticus JOP 1030-1 TaxID=1450539 RepID=A0A318Z7I2_9EURO|nr:putative alkaline phytoceramidase [Aspergillus saccharolyticus JOP 1030-1]PYH43079.1 putative alkaline phytoceramidase [Aspergillus saccharolyticus JOP 1030-1]
MDVSLKDPFWGPQTSYLNFCEEDYVVTRYVAEFINTSSSLIYILYGIYGLNKLRQKPISSLARAIPWFGLMGVGVCSAGYHMTLKYHTQMSDELSMHLLTTPLVYRILTFQVSPRWRRWIGIALCIEFTTVMVVHMVMDEFLLHAVTFGAGALLIARRTMQAISHKIPDPLIKQKTRNIGRFGIFCFLFGYFAWLVDVWACNYLINIRQFIGVPLAYLFELHGWWHFFTAIGGYIAVAVVDMITSGEVHTDPTPQLAWPVSLAARTMGPNPPASKRE